MRREDGEVRWLRVCKYTVRGIVDNGMECRHEREKGDNGKLVRTLTQIS